MSSTDTLIIEALASRDIDALRALTVNHIDDPIDISGYCSYYCTPEMYEYMDERYSIDGYCIMNMFGSNNTELLTHHIENDGVVELGNALAWAINNSQDEIIAGDKTNMLSIISDVYRDQYIDTLATISLDRETYDVTKECLALLYTYSKTA